MFFSCVSFSWPLISRVDDKMFVMMLMRSILFYFFLFRIGDDGDDLMKVRCCDLALHFFIAPLYCGALACRAVKCTSIYTAGHRDLH